MINHIKRNIPFRIKILIKKTFYLGTRYYCNCCGSHIRSFCSGGEDLPPIIENKVTGAGYRKQDYCPVCKSTYRHRLVWMYLSNLKIWKKQLSVLHIAPEEMIARKLSGIKHLNYITGDSNPDRYRHYTSAIRLDITHIPFEDNTFDVIICNHVLEHIADDRKAMNELYRVLKPGGFSMMQVPLSSVLRQTYEDPLTTTEEERIKCYGQKDHVRIYGEDYYRRLEDAAFKLEITGVSEYSHVPRINRMALHENEKVVIGFKQEKT